MRFQSRYKSITYVVEPAYPATTGRDPQPEIRGLRAKFTGPKTPSGDPFGVPSFFDSEQAQRAHHWSDEQRLQVERHLLTHPDFGNGLYVGVGETIPPEHADLAINVVSEVPAPQSEPLPEAFRCGYVRLNKDGSTWQCGKKAGKDGDYCSQHEQMLATASAK